MGKGKPRRNPNKRQNLYGSWCSYAEEMPSGQITCENSFIADCKICEGNPHNCIKIKYHNLASMSDRQKNETM